VLRAAAETETMQENIQDCPELEEAHSGFQILTEEEISAVTVSYLFLSVLRLLLKFSFICIISFFVIYGNLLFR
jgi:hypothetical protein